MVDFSFYVCHVWKSRVAKKKKVSEYKLNGKSKNAYGYIRHL